MPKRAYIDTSVLIAAFQGKGALGRRALEVLDDPERALIVSDAVRLESLPKARYNKQESEVAFYEAVFNRADNLPWDSAALQNAYTIAERHGMAAMDAIHVALAIAADVDEFVTAEKPNKPIFRVRTISIHSIQDVSSP
jgi:predicted nucleic acid-binding protein